MRSNNYQTVANYLNGCYKEGFVGAMYDLQGQGIPLAEDCNCRCCVITHSNGWDDYDKTKFFRGTEGMSDKQKQILADKRGITVEELEKYKNSIIPMEASNYDVFRKQYEKLWNHESLYVKRI